MEITGRRFPPSDGGILLTLLAFAQVILPAMSALRIIPLGGLGEVGKNLTVYELDDEIVIVDAGLAFPATSISASISSSRTSRICATRGRCAPCSSRMRTRTTSAALPYLMRDVEVPEIWATRLTLGLLQSKLDEHGLLHASELREAVPGGRRRRDRLVPRRVRADGALGPGHRRDRARGGTACGSCTPATTSSTTRPWTACAPTWASSPRSATAASTSCSATRRTRSVPASPARSGSSGRRSARSSRCARGGFSSRASPRTSTACSRPSTSPSRPGARSASSAARCART